MRSLGMAVSSVMLILIALAAATAQSPQKELGLPESLGERMRFSSPTEGQVVSAGDSLDIEITVDEGIELELVTVVLSGGMMMLRQPPFRGKLFIQPERIGRYELMALGRTTDGKAIEAVPVSFVVTAGNATLEQLIVADKKVRIPGPGHHASVRATGVYSDGIKRDVSQYKTHYDILEGSDAVCIVQDRVLVGRAPGRALVRITHDTLSDTVTVLVESRPARNNPPRADLRSRIVGKVGERLCIDASLCHDWDECLGEPLEPDSIKWDVGFPDTTFSARGFELCFVPGLVGEGLLQLTVTDRHGASSSTMSKIVVKE